MVASIIDLGARAKHAGRRLARASTAQKNAALLRIADGLTAFEADILNANAGDVQAALARRVEPYFVDRLALNEQRLAAIAHGVRNVAALPDPVGEQFEHETLPNGLRLHKRRVPLGVLACIYESRPNVTIDIAALALKSGNAAVLRGGSDNLASNKAMLRVISAALANESLPEAAVQLIEDTDRARILDLLRLNDYIDLIIPRGGAALHDLCRKNSTIPVITGGMGINHIFVDESADQAQAADICFNAKVSAPSVCNSLGTVLVHSAISTEFLPALAARMGGKAVELHCDPRSFAALGGLQNHNCKIVRADDARDWDIEWLALTAGVRVVDSIDEAIAFIHAHSLEHSDGIVSRDAVSIEKFINEVDSCGVFVNASTRFNDGSQFGLGAEVAVSTQRIHARGPLGLRELTSYKWVCEGDGHVRW